jgi:hypothetical protein
VVCGIEINAAALLGGLDGISNGFAGIVVPAIALG